MSEVIRASLEGIKDFAEIDTVVGKEILTESGVTVIPVSRINIAFATGGADIGQRKIATPLGFASGGITGVSITPIAFLTVDGESKVSVVPVSIQESYLDRISGLVDKAPELINKIKKALS